MGFFDTLSNITSGVSDFAKQMGPIAGIAGAGYDIYQGIRSSKLADKYSDIAFASAEEQNKYAKEMFERQKSLYWPLEQQQIDYTKGMLGVQQQYDPTLAAGKAQYAQSMLGVQQQYDPAIAAKQAQYMQSMLDIQQQFQPGLTYLKGQDALNFYTGTRPLQYAQMQYAVDRGLADIEQQKQLDPTYRETEKSVIRKLTEGEDILAGRMRTQAQADVAQKFGAQTATDQTKMGLAGISSGSQQYANYLSKMGRDEALASAASQTQATTQAENLALSRQAQALNYRQGASLPTSQYTPMSPQYAMGSQQYTPTVGTANIMGGSQLYGSTGLSGLGGSVSNMQGMAGMFGNQAQQSLSGASYLLNQLMGGNK